MDINTFIIIGVAIIVVILTFVLTPYLKKKNIINDENTYIANQIITFAKIMLNKNVKDEKDKKRINMVIDIIEDMIDYVHENSLNKSIDERKEMAKDFVVNQLRYFNIEIDQEEHVLIDIIIDNVVRYLVK
jgi:dipeptide/tripeptide permease